MLQKRMLQHQDNLSLLGMLQAIASRTGVTGAATAAAVAAPGLAPLKQEPDMLDLKPEQRNILAAGQCKSEQHVPDNKEESLATSSAAAAARSAAGGRGVSVGGETVLKRRGGAAGSCGKRPKRSVSPAVAPSGTIPVTRSRAAASKK